MRVLSGVWLFLCCTFSVYGENTKWKQIHEACQTPNNVQGTCIELSQCNEVFSLILLPRPLPNTVVQFLLQSQCGEKDGGPLVCCPTTSTTIPPTVGTDSPTILGVDNNADTVGTDSPNRILGGDNNADTVGTDSPNRILGDDNNTDHQNMGLINQQFCGLNADARINMGQKTSFNEFPWMALLAYRKRSGKITFDCGGTLINPWYVLTAAHCITYRKSLELISVRLGDHDYSKEDDCDVLDDETICAAPYQNRDIDRVFVHPQCGRGKHDIALIRLAQPVDTTKDNVQPICLPTGADLTRNLDGLMMTVAGWGMTENGSGNSELLKVSLPIVSEAQCRNSTHFDISNCHICAGGSNSQQDSCNGDSGGPLKMYQDVGPHSPPAMVQYGIVSFGRSKCGTPGIPAIYTRVSYYMDWILKTIKP